MAIEQLLKMQVLFYPPCFMVMGCAQVVQEASAKPDAWPVTARGTSGEAPARRTGILYFAFCAVAGMLFAMTGWELYTTQRTAKPGGGEMKVYTWSAEARPSDPDSGLVRTAKKSWTRLPNS